MSTTTTDAAGQDFTLDPGSVKTGQLAFEYGYVPVVVFGVVDGKVEVARFGGFEYVNPGDLSTHRGPLPSAALPEAVSSQDRITTLEKQVEALLTLVQEHNITAPAPAPAPDAPAPAPAAPEASPFGTP